MGRPKKIVPKGAETVATDLETRQRIIQAARTLFGEKGFKGVSVKDIAEAVSITPAALYYYFPDGKEALFMAVLEVILDERKEGMERAISTGLCIKDRLYALTLFFLTNRNDALPVLMRDVAVQVRNGQRQSNFWHRLGGDYATTVTKVFQEGAASGEITTNVSPELLATLFSGMNFTLGRSIHHHAQPGRSDFAEMEPEKLARTVVDILFNGIRGM